MEPLNYTRILLGGLLAGLIINMIDVPNSIFLAGPSLQRLLKRQNAMSSRFVPPYFLGIHFALGIATVFLYAAMKPLLGAGWTTAIVAASVLVLVQRMFTLGNVLLGQLTLQIFLSLSWSLVLGSLLGAVAGAWFYDR